MKVGVDANAADANDEMLMPLEVLRDKKEMGDSLSTISHISLLLTQILVNLFLCHSDPGLKGLLGQDRQFGVSLSRIPSSLLSFTFKFLLGKDQLFNSLFTQFRRHLITPITLRLIQLTQLTDNEVSHPLSLSSNYTSIIHQPSSTINDKKLNENRQLTNSLKNINDINKLQTPKLLLRDGKKDLSQTRREIFPRGCAGSPARRSAECL